MPKKYYLPDEEFYLSDAWFELKEKILERDEYVCRQCGTSENLSVHHIVPRRYKYLVEFDIDSPNNLISMCWNHHGMADRKVDMYGRSLQM